MQLESKRIIITRGASGVTYLKEGAIVASLDINDEHGEQVVHEASEIGPGKET
ncbi:hypothetical protein [Virgibacillus sp. CBA3643]|uniref:hypothetical protein n=1 Tax=Virgibacillus sp. CBA3643 TaxID=2942278 RepID=UPI0035A26E23